MLMFISVLVTQSHRLFLKVLIKVLTKPGEMMCLVIGGFCNIMFTSICNDWTIMSVSGQGLQ